MNYEFVANHKAARIKVIGVGGAGNNAVDNMIACGLGGVGFIAANTDLQTLENNKAATKLQLGINLTKGLGCGANPEVGREAALEDAEAIMESLGDSDMVFITAGMGGGTGTGGAPVVAELLKSIDNPPLTVAVVSKPFGFEGKKRLSQAESGIEQLRQWADTIITIPNNRLLATAPRGMALSDAFKMADDILLQAVRGVSDLILMPGLINLDFADAKTVMSKKGLALMGTGVAGGPDRAAVAAEKAVSSPLLDNISIKGAQGLLINISARTDNIALDEVNHACTFIQKEVDENADVIFGVAWDDDLGDDLAITVIATGIGQETATQTPPRRTPPRQEVPNLEDVHKDRTGKFDRPTATRNGRLDEEGARRSRSRWYDNSFPQDDENLDEPTFKRIARQ